MPYIKPKVLGYYQNTIALFDIDINAVWALIEYNKLYPDIGNPGSGALVYCWTPDGNCQESGWCGGTFIIPGQYAKSAYFKKSRIKGGVPSFMVSDSIDTTITFSNGSTKVLSLEDYSSVLEMGEK